MPLSTAQKDLLLHLSRIDSPSSDEGAMADWLERWIPGHTPDAALTRIGDSLIAVRGVPRTALFAHIDTTGFLLGYDNTLTLLGSPAPTDKEPLRQTGSPGRGATILIKGRPEWTLSNAQGAQPGSRWVYDRPLEFAGNRVVGPYLDNRGGVWAALEVLARCDDVAVAFTVCEESTARGALVCGRYLYESRNINQALISDITWDTAHIHNGDGPAVSLRDRMAPRQRYLRRVLDVAEASGIRFQREIETEGGSDGHALERSGLPIDWVFVGAPQRYSHSSREEVDVDDLCGMADLLAALVNGL